MLCFKLLIAMALFNPIEALETSSLSQESFNFDFAGDFSDKNIDIDAGFSAALIHQRGFMEILLV